MSAQMQKVVAKVIVSLKRMGLNDVDVSAIGKNSIRISGTVAHPDEKALACAVVKTTPGVSVVTDETIVSRAKS
jgi:hypothetical protein